MALSMIRLELARTPDFPEGSAQHGYEFMAPLTADGQLDRDGWHRHRSLVGSAASGPERTTSTVSSCTIAAASGRSCTTACPRPSQEPIFRFDRHRFAVGEYVAITEHDGAQRTFRVVQVAASEVAQGRCRSSLATGASIMSIRIILTPLFGGAADAGALNVGLGIAHRFQAHLGALFVRIDPFDAIPVVGEGVSPAIVDQLTEAAAAEMDRQRAAARATFEVACSAASSRSPTPARPGPFGRLAGGDRPP